MAKPVSKEVAEKYIDGYFKKKYPIRESAQPTFWDAVKELVVNINADVSELINEDKSYCVPSDEYSSGHISRYGKGIKTVTDFAKTIAQQIIESESKPVSPAEVFLMERRIESLEERMGYAEMRHKKYR